MEKAARFLQTPGLTPDCYNLPEFLALERMNSRVLEEYAWHVLARPRSQEEDERTRQMVFILREAIERAISPDERMGQCLNIAGLVHLVLIAHGVWSFVVKGSTKTEFDADLRLRPQYFWSRDEQLDFEGGFTGHAWVVAPPFFVVDMAAAAQRWRNGEQQHLEQSVIAESQVAGVVPPCAELLHPDPATCLPALGHDPSLIEFWHRLTPRRVRSGRAMITYQPDGVAAPDTDIAGLSWPTFGGRLPLRFYEEDLKFRLQSLRIS